MNITGAPGEEAPPEGGDGGAEGGAAPDVAVAAAAVPAPPPEPPKPDPVEEARKAREEELKRKNEERQMGIQERQLKLQEELIAQLAKSEEEAVKEQGRLEELLAEDVMYDEILTDLHKLKKSIIRLEKIRKDDTLDELKEEILDLHNKFHEVQLEEDLEEFDVKDLKKEIMQLQEENRTLMKKSEDMKVDDLKRELNQLQKVNSQLHETMLKDRSSQARLQKAISYKHLYNMHELRSKSKIAGSAGGSSKTWDGPSLDVAEMDRKMCSQDLDDLYSDYKQMFSRVKSRGATGISGTFGEKEDQASLSMNNMRPQAQFVPPNRFTSHQDKTGEKINYCHNFQIGRCPEKRDHVTYVRGAPRFYRHICGKCYSTNGELNRHPFTSSDCKFNGGGGGQSTSRSKVEEKRPRKSSGSSIYSK